MKTISALIFCLLASAPVLQTLRADCLLPPSGLVAWWGAEGTALDTAGNNHGALTNGAGFTPGMAGQAFAFDGTNDFFLAPDSAALRPASLTLEGWFRFNAVTFSPVALVSKPVGPGTANSFALYLDRADLSGTAGNAGGITELKSTFTPVAGQWHHLAYTFNDATDTHVLYADGVMVASGANTCVVGYDGHPILIGAESNNEVLFAFFNGQVDEPAIYNRALNAAEIAAIFNAGSAGKCAGPKLQIRALPGVVQLSWTTNAAGYLLETNGGLPFPSGWGVLTSNYNVLTTNYAVTDAIGGATRFYRLHKPEP